MTRVAILALALLALAACVPGDGGSNGPARPYCRYQNVPGCLP